MTYRCIDFFVLSQPSVGRLPVSNVQGYSMHRESLALTSRLSCRTGLPQECYQNPNGDKKKNARSTLQDIIIPKESNYTTATRHDTYKNQQGLQRSAHLMNRC